MWAPHVKINHIGPIIFKVSKPQRSIAMPELLSPAGNFEKLKAALLYGADAVYIS